MVVLCVLFMELEPLAEAGVGAGDGDGEGIAFGSGVDIAVAAGQKNEIRIVQPTNGERISGKTHIKLQVGRQDPYKAPSRSKHQKSGRLA